MWEKIGGISINNLCYLNGVKDKSSFTRQEILDSFRNNGFTLGNASFSKKHSLMIKSGELVHIGRDLYCLPKDDKYVYSHEYSDLANEVAQIMKQQYPLLDFCIFEKYQLNQFVNHLIARNTIFLSVEADAMDFVFMSLIERYPGKVLINPTPKIFHRYWSENMIVITKLITEAPKGLVEKWHTRLEKVLVDVVSDKLLVESIGESEYSYIYGDAFKYFVIDEKCLFRYARRRGCEQRVKKIIG